MEEFAKTYVPLIGALISLVSVLIAFFTLRHARNDRLEERRAAEADARRREQERREQQEAAERDAIRREQERSEQQKAAEADALRREQETLFTALQGDKEAVAFMALQLSRDPHLVTESNRTRLFSAMCLAFVFESSSRARALVLKTLRQFSVDDRSYGVITEILNEIEADFRAYDKGVGEDELKDYLKRIKKLKESLRMSS
jgi:hypothetical protein